MARIGRRACLRLGLAVAPLALTVSGLPALAAVPPPEVAEAERYMSLLVNTARKDHRLGTLALERNLTQAARDYASLLLSTGQFSHTGPDGSTLDKRVGATRYDFVGNRGLGENLGVRTRGTGRLMEDVRLVQDGLMNSPGHRENILRPSYTHIGIGLQVGRFAMFDGRISVLAVQVFSYTDGVPDLMP